MRSGQQQQSIFMAYQDTRKQMETTYISANIEHTHKINKQKYNKQINLTIKDYDYQVINKIVFMKTLLIQEIQDHQPYLSNYYIFHVPFSMLCCQILTLNQQNIKYSGSFIEDLLKFSIKKMSKISQNQKNQEIKRQIMDNIMDCLKYKQNYMRKDYYQQKLSTFLQKNERKMQTFIPIYYQLFTLVNNYHEKINKQTSYSDLQNQFNSKKKELRQKYHDKTLQ